MIKTLVGAQESGSPTTVTDHVLDLDDKYIALMRGGKGSEEETSMVKGFVRKFTRNLLRLCAKINEEKDNIRAQLLQDLNSQYGALAPDEESEEFGRQYATRWQTFLNKKIEDVFPNFDTATTAARKHIGQSVGAAAVTVTQ